MPTSGSRNDEAVQAAHAAAAVYAWQRGVKKPEGLPDYVVDRVFECIAGDTGFFAAGFRHKMSETLILSVCGCNDSRDFAAAANLAVCQYEANRSGLLDYLACTGRQDIILAGHSLGGALCQYLAYDLVRNQVAIGQGDIGERLRVFTFNGLGGISGIMRLHGTVDPDVVAKITAVHFAHPDDVIPRIGGYLGGQVHMIADKDPLIAPIRACHHMNVFLAGDGSSPIHEAVACLDQPFGVTATADRLGPLLRKAIIEWMSGERISAGAKIAAMWPAVPQSERWAVMQILICMSGLARIYQRVALSGLQLYRKIRSFAGLGVPKT